MKSGIIWMNSLVVPKSLFLTLTVLTSMLHVCSLSGSSDKTINNASKKCYHSFQVNRSSIIRTQDSKSEGAKYLDEADKSSHQDCLKWCCETSNCTVAVYEEKKQGSCYLFDCGPADKNLCKFTSYSNYTSALLTVSRHALELEQLSSNKAMQSSAPVTTVRSTELTPTKTTTNKNEQQVDRTCGRNQFQCRNDSTCIAIYNVCDGVYQCGDHSDEDDALGCPPEDDGVKTSDTEKEVKPTTKSVIKTGNKIPSQVAWKDNAARESQRIDQDVYNQYQQENFNRYPSGPEDVKGIPVVNQINPLNIGKEQKQDALFYHKGLNLMGPPESFAQQSQYNHQNMRSGASSDYISRPMYDNQDIVEVVKQPPIETRYNQRQNNYQDYYQADAPVRYHKHRYNDIVQPVPVDNNNNGRFKDQQQSYSQYQSSQNLYGNGNQAASVDQYSNLNYPIHVYERPPEQIVMRRPVNNYDISGQQIGQAPLSNLPENLKYSAEVPDRRPAKPVNIESKDNDYIRNEQFLNLHEQSELQSDNYPSPHLVDNDNFSINQNSQPGTDSKTSHIRAKSRPVYTNRHKEVIKEYPTSSVKKQSVVSSPVVTEKPRSTTTGTSSLPKELAVSKMKLKLSKEEKRKSSPVYEEVNLSELEVNPRDSSQSNGAYIALSLGLVLTGLLVVLVGCRLKVVRHRILHGRNGRSPLAHDADYLVNGMYL